MKLIDYLLIPKLKLLFEYSPELGEIADNYKGVIYHIERIDMYVVTRLVNIDYPGDNKIDLVSCAPCENSPSKFKAMVFLKYPNSRQ